MTFIEKTPVRIMSILCYWVIYTA